MIEELLNYLKKQIESKEALTHIEECVNSSISTAGTKSREEIFTREFLCPTLASFFYDEVFDQLNLNENEIEKGLGTEGYKNVSGFGFTPARQGKHFFTKGQVISSEPPEAWYKASKKRLTSYMACPDFALRSPLPLAIVGETKYFVKGSKEVAVRELYNDIRQCMFYLGAFNEYTDALLVVADASPEHSFSKAFDLLNEDLVSRFGSDTNIHLCVINLT